MGEDPGNLAAWIELARQLQALGRYQEAADAWGRAVGLSEGNPIITGAYAVSLVEASGGTVTAQAVAAFERSLAADPSDPRPRFYLALAQMQEGDAAGALAAWGDLLSESPADAPWVQVVRDHMAMAAEMAGVPIPDIEPLPALAAGPRQLPDSDTAAAIAGLDAPDQRAAIEGMVERLAARLADNPGDIAGWLCGSRNRAAFLGDLPATLQMRLAGPPHWPRMMSRLPEPTPMR